jgi:hypothetical protein
VRGDDERRHRQRLGIDPQRELGHRDVAADRDLVDLLGRGLRLLADLARELGHRRRRAALQLGEGVRIHHRRRDARDHVAAERLLAVEHRAHGERLAGLEIQQGRHHRRGAEVERDRVADGRRVAGLDCDQLLVDDHRRDPEVSAAQHAAELAHHLESHVRLEVVDRVEQPLHVGALVFQRGLVELDVALLHGGPQNHVAPDADERRLRARLQRRHVHHEVLPRGRAAREAPAGA